MKYTYVITCSSLDSGGCLDQIPSHALANNLMTGISFIVACALTNFISEVSQKVTYQKYENSSMSLELEAGN